MQQSFSIMRKKGSLKSKVLWPLAGGLAIGWYGVTRVLGLIRGTDEDIMGVIITGTIGLLTAVVMIWQVVEWFRTGKHLVTFSAAAIQFPQERIPVRRIQKLSVGWERIAVTKANGRVIELDLSLYTSGISREESAAIEAWAQEHGIVNYYGPNDADREMKDLEAEYATTATAAEAAGTQTARDDAPVVLKPVVVAKRNQKNCGAPTPQTLESETRYGWKIWLITIWAMLALLGLLIMLINIPGEIRLAYFFRYTKTAGTVNLNDILPGKAVKVAGAVESNQSFQSVWDKQPVVYERQTYLVRFRGKTSREKTLVHKAVPFRIQTDSGQRVLVQPGVRPGSRDLFELKVTGDDGPYTDWTIKTGERISVYGPIRREGREYVMNGAPGKRLLIANLPAERLNPVNRLDFWIYMTAWLCFSSGALALGIAIGRYYSKK